MAACRGSTHMMRAAVVLPCLLLAAGAHAGEAQDERDEQQEHGAAQPGAPLTLTPAQQEAVGIRIARPIPLGHAQTLAAFGTVLDPALLAADVGRAQGTRAAAAAAAAEAERLERLYREDAQASLRASQAAQAQAVEARAQAQAAAASLRLQWGPLAGWSDARTQALLAELERGERLLVRAEVPGYRAAAAPGDRALIEVDGAQVEARVLGVLPRSDAPVQGTGWLLETGRPPPGLGPGARVPVQLAAATACAGLLVPAAALVYGADGAHVYRALGAGAAMRYAAVSVRPLARVGDAWLVDGLSGADQIVVQGAGVLWSLAGLGSFTAAEEEHD